MIDVDRLQFWVDVGSAPVSGVSLCLVLFGFRFVQPVGLEAGAYGIAGVACVVATAASLLVVQHRVTDSPVPEEYPAAIRELLPISWAVIPVLMIVPVVSEPRWQLVFVLLATFGAVLGIAALLVVIYNWFTFSVATSPPPSHDGS